MSPFDFVKDISYGKKGIFDENTQHEYIPYIVNRAFSYYLNVVMFANEMNMHSVLGHKLQYDFLFNSIRKQKRYSPWHKKEINAEEQAVSEYFKYNTIKAKEALKLLSKDDVDYMVSLKQQKDEEIT